MSGKKLLSQSCRTLPASIPRRQALKLMTSMAAACAFGVWFGPSKSQAQDKSKATPQINPCDFPVASLVVANASVETIIRTLRAEFQAPVSFIQALSRNKISIHVVSGTVKDVLRQLVQQDQSYLWESYQGHTVVFPSEPKYQKAVTLHVGRGKRTDVTMAYAAYLRAKVPGFERFYGLAIVGEYSSDIFDAMIALPTSGTVLHLFMDLLAADPVLMFSDLPEDNGTYTIGFNTITDFRPA